MENDAQIADAVRNALSAKAIVVVTAGAGMGVDSGLPDFRGPEGFWKAYPPYRHLGLQFTDLANPRWFKDDPAFAWGFYGHRLNLYRNTVPHAGYDVLRRVCERAAAHVVFTSNVDGAFVKAGFNTDVIERCHGDIHRLQCSEHDHGIWAAHAIVDVDEQTFRATSALPRCAECGAVARPNILMFNDWGFDASEAEHEERRVHAILDAADPAAPHVIIECGAGRAIPTVRMFGERLLRAFPNATLIRINMREAEADDARTARRVLSVASGAKAALLSLEALLEI